MGATWTLPAALGTTVTAAQLEHRVPCWGYVLQEAPPPLAPARALLAEHGVAPVRAPARQGLGRVAIPPAPCAPSVNRGRARHR
jgi:ribonuclease Z